MSTVTPNLGLIKPNILDGGKLWPAEYAQNLNTLDDQLVASDYETYSPVFTASTTNVTFGTAGFVQGNYLTLGPFLTIVRIRVFMGGTSGFVAGSGQYRLTLPFVANAIHTIDAQLGVGDIIGRVYMRDATSDVDSGTAAVQLHVNSPATIVMPNEGGVASSVSHNLPFVWAANDSFTLMAKYLRA